MTLYLREEEVASLLTMGDAIPIVETVFKTHALGHADNPPRQQARLPYVALHVMPAAVPGIGLGLKAGVKTNRLGGTGVRAIVLLWNEDTKDLEAIIEANQLGQIRTGAASGVATKYLARTGATAVGILGCGHQAESQLQAVCAVRPIDEVSVYSRTREHRETFAAKMSESLGIPVTPFDTPEQVVADADIVITITTSSEPLFDGSWLPPGAHINAAGSNRPDARELDTETIRRSHLVCIDNRSQGRMEAGDLIAAVRKGVIAWEGVAELGEIVVGRVPGRRRDDEITLFKSIGVAIEDVAIARHVYTKAIKTGAGQKLHEPFIR